MSWKKERFAGFKLYAVTDLREDSPRILEKAEAVCRGGADILQLRSKFLPDAVLFRLAVRLREIAERHQKLLFVNDRVDIALAACADGVHLGQDDLPVAEARRLAGLAGHPLWVGKSTHSLEQALEAARETPDYIGVGPVFGTPTKPGYRPVGLDLVRRVNASLTIPFVAIGGIDETNLSQVLEAGARRIAVVRALFDQEKPYEAANRLRETMERYYAESV